PVLQRGAGGVLRDGEVEQGPLERPPPPELAEDKGVVIAEAMDEAPACHRRRRLAGAAPKDGSADPSIHGTARADRPAKPWMERRVPDEVTAERPPDPPSPPHGLDPAVREDVGGVVQPEPRRGHLGCGSRGEREVPLRFLTEEHPGAATRVMP